VLGLPLDTFSVLKDIVDRPGVPGFEEQRRSCIAEYFSRLCDGVSVDVIGNVIGTLGGGDRSVMLAGHYDQIGFMVRHVDKEGYAYFDQVGGWDPRVVYGARVRVWTGQESASWMPGTIGARPVHVVERAEQEKAVKLADMHIDLGAENKEEAAEMGVRPGCVVTLDSPVVRLGKPKEKEDGLVMGAGFDDASSVVSFIKALELLAEEPPKRVKVHAVATVQEEIGARGAQVSGFNIHPWCAVAVDVAHALAPGVKPSRVGEINLGAGPAIGVGANFTRALWSLMEEVARAEGIPYQIEPVPGPSGTDAWVLQVLRGGAVSGLISIPNRYMHSPNEVISLSDLNNAGRLLAATVRGLQDRDIKQVTELFRKK